MCGISAIYRYTCVSDEDRNRLSRMNSEMSYRGPDGCEVWTDDKCGLAHTRLSIIGIDNGRQPLLSGDGQIVLICNGEIYNYVELKNELKGKGYEFMTDSDSETILHLYEEYDVYCLKHLRGMFAFCLYDKRKKRLFAARDRMGEKPLYFSQIQTGVVFSSELKAILKNYIDKPQIDSHALAESIRYNYPIDLRNTFVRQIKRVCAGEYVIVDDGGIEVRKYWSYRSNPTFDGSKDETKKEILRLMRESVDMTLRSDVPVAVLLSSGIDSTAIAALAKETGREIHVITAGYRQGGGVDERSAARRFAKEKGLVYHEVELDVSDFKSIFDIYTKYIDEPVCDVSSMSQWALYQKASELGFKVLLSGVGGDELFYGYPAHNKLAESLILAKEHRDLFPWKSKKLQFMKFMLRNWRYVLYAGYPEKIDDSLPVRWTYDDYVKFSRDAEMEIWGDRFEFKDIDVHYSFSSEADIDTVYEFMTTRFMNTLCLYLADRLGMGNSVEVRCPLLDYKLTEFVTSLPRKYRYEKGNAKSLMKEALCGILPDYILNASKRGFTPPFGYIYEMNSEYKYKNMQSSSVFFNSMLADKLIENLK